MEWLGVAAAACELAALWMIGSKRVGGFAIGIAGNALWIGYVAMSGHGYGLLLVCPVALALNVRGWRKWTTR